MLENITRDTIQQFRGPDASAKEKRLRRDEQPTLFLRKPYCTCTRKRPQGAGCLGCRAGTLRDPFGTVQKCILFGGDGVFKSAVWCPIGKSSHLPPSAHVNTQPPGGSCPECDETQPFASATHLTRAAGAPPKDTNSEVRNQLIDCGSRVTDEGWRACDQHEHTATSRQLQASATPHSHKCGADHRGVRCAQRRPRRVASSTIQERPGSRLEVRCARSATAFDPVHVVRDTSRKRTSAKELYIGTTAGRRTSDQLGVVLRELIIVRTVNRDARSRTQACMACKLLCRGTFGMVAATSCVQARVATRRRTRVRWHAFVASILSLQRAVIFVLCRVSRRTTAPPDVRSQDPAHLPCLAVASFNMVWGRFAGAHIDHASFESATLHGAPLHGRGGGDSAEPSRAAARCVVQNDNVIQIQHGCANHAEWDRTRFIGRCGAREAASQIHRHVIAQLLKQLRQRVDCVGGCGAPAGEAACERHATA